MSATPNSAQNPANHLDSHLRIIACAGSGKTSFVAERIGHILSQGVSPSSIIAFTYTEKAAVELNNRINVEVKKRGLSDTVRHLADMYVGTIHGWCLKALHDHEIGYQKYSVLDDIKLRLFVDKNYKNIGMKEIVRMDKPDTHMRMFIDTGKFIELMNIIRESETTGSLPESISEALKKYEGLMRQSGFFDFTMIMTEALEKLRSSSSGLFAHISNSLKYLIVDEYQDINPVQNKLIVELEKASKCAITVVGDDDQNIYQWRGSNSRFLKQFDEQFVHSREVRSLALEVNYRSSKGVTGLAEHLIERNLDRIPKRMISAEKQAFIRDEDVLYSEFDSPKAEAQSIANRIQSLRGSAFEAKDGKRGLDYSDFCILLRTWKKSEEIAAVLEEAGIPHVTSGINQLFDTKEVQAAVGIYQYLSELISANQLRDQWLQLHTNSIDIDKLDYAIDKLSAWLPDKFQSHRKTQSWGDYNLQEVFWEFLKNSEIVEEVFVNANPASPIQAEVVFYNLGKFSQVIQDYESIYLNSAPPEFHLFNFINFIQYAAQDYYPEGRLQNPYRTPNAVQIMTIYQAKGLEFPVVFIPGLNKNYFPHKRAGGLKVWHFLDRKLIRDHHRYEARDDAQRFEDERRLLYVAITRSQKYLFISRAPELNNQLYKQKSLFVDELVSDFIQEPQRELTFDWKERLAPTPRTEAINLSLSFSILKDIFQCGYRFKLISMYGFCFPLNQRMGLGKSTHDSLMAIHKSISKGELLDEKSLSQLAQEQSHFPFLGKSTELQKMKDMVRRNAVEYYYKNQDELKNIEFVEQDIRLSLDDGIYVNGRVDLVKRKVYEGEYETTIMEFKSNDGVQEKSATLDQLNLYALGYRELVGRDADYVQVYEVESNKPNHRSKVDAEQLAESRARIHAAALRIRNQAFERVTQSSICKDCYQNRVCSARIVLGIPAKK